MLLRGYLHFFFEVPIVGPSPEVGEEIVSLPLLPVLISLFILSCGVTVKLLLRFFSDQIVSYVAFIFCVYGRR